MPAVDSKKLAYSGILLALLIILLLIRTMLPVNRLSLYVFSSFILGIVLIETNLRYALLFYVSSVLLTLFLPVDKLSLFLFYTFFGVYGIVKHLLEKIRSKFLVLLAKILYFLLIFLANYLFAYAFIPFVSTLDFPLFFIILLATTAFIGYDFIYSLIAVFYMNRISKIIWRNKNDTN
ncbi:MAG: hypothetical protein R6W96_01660 [Clostridia bacterium]